MSFWTSLGEELGERRRRMRRALQPWRAGLIEFLFLTGFILGFGAPIVHGAAALPWWTGLLPPLIFLVGYALVDLGRQRAIAAGAAEEEARKRAFAPTLAVTIIAPLLGALVYLAPIWARPPAPPPPVEEKSDFLPADPGHVPETVIVR